ncbi:hypothetical protein H8R18_07710 [Nanchangia anserum]|uniref:Uncharacterized protein n=1 Tax=Nanchangia anserum TaxID=2692125 RepID=A0A8I0KU79_9ACTO|nr:hypothetical protein [Nanchangia anserum]MBD3689408.1 hypothetical protein [Nanchangia anserum]QOX81615.1 hypothetical protein H8R18_07710 [Nanchangia anserum]
MRIVPRLALVLCALVALICGLDAALSRAALPALDSDGIVGAVHGPLMVHGFLLVVIGVERAIALESGGRRIGFIVPAIASVGSVVMAAEIAATSWRGHLLEPPVVPGLIWLAALLGLVIVEAALWTRRRDISVLVEIVGVCAWMEGTALWTMRLDTASAVLWWGIGLMLFISGERLDLARLEIGQGLSQAVLWLGIAIVLSAALTLVSPQIASIPLGALLAILSLVMVRRDVARRAWRLGGTAGFSGIAMLAAWAWLAGVGAAIMVAGLPRSGYAFDALTHAITIGFVLSMILAHAPIIFPAILHHRVAVTVGSWAGLILLHVALLIRVASGMRGIDDAWRFGAALAVGALLVFVVTTMAASARSSR